MKKNLPVTQRTYLFPDGKTLMSTTDTRSCITYANSAFQGISGFDRDELIGQPHNLVRHPDMPSAAFADMWATLKEGRTWTGLVKNRRKDGDHYWVRANVTPMRSNGSTVGYMSVRTKPSEHEIRTIEPIYAALQVKTSKKWGLRRGLLYRKGLAGVLGRSRFLSVSWRIGMCVTLGALPAMGVVAVLADTAAMATFYAALLAIGAVTAFALLHWQIVRPLRKAVTVVRAVASCEPVDIGIINRGDEFGELLRGISQCGLNLASLLDDVDEQVEGLRQASGEVANSSNDLAMRTERAAANLQESAAAMEEFAATVESNTSTTAAADERATSVTDVARAGGIAIESVIKQMRAIADSSEKIAEFTSVIDSIAFQTNILALNAAVEAARAGDQGRGFAVVAAEVRGLAQRATAAAKEISGFIERSVVAVQGGSKLVDEAGATIKNVAGSVNEVNQMIADLAQAAKEQTDTISSVSIALNDLDSMTHENAALVEESSAAAESLHRQSQALAEAVAAFRQSGADRGS